MIFPFMTKVISRLSDEGCRCRNAQPEVAEGQAEGKEAPPTRAGFKAS